MNLFFSARHEKWMKEGFKTIHDIVEIDLSTYIKLQRAHLEEEERKRKEREIAAIASDP